MEYSSYIYNNNPYTVCTSAADPSGKGCIQEIIHQNEYRLETFADIRSHIVDIGANCGVATIILAKQNPRSTIYAFEPDPRVYELLLENVKINGLTNVKCHNMAVSDGSKRSLTLYLHPNFSGGNTTCSDENGFRTFFHADGKSFRVDCISLDEIIVTNHIDSIELLKIDCEGAEFEILRGSRLFRTGIVKNIVGEFHNLRYNTQSTNDVDGLLEYCKEHVDGFMKMTLLSL